MRDPVFGERRRYTNRVVEKLKQTLNRELGARHGELIGDHTCVYATGSCGRGEMGHGSDLDAYIVQLGQPDPARSKVIETAVKKAVEAAQLPPMDAGGRHLVAVDARQILDLLGAPEDDKEGVLTKRILLLLESNVLLGGRAHDQLVGDVIEAYWRNHDRHPKDYLPIVLVNDIVRYWRIVLLNHESRLRKKEREIEADSHVDEGQRAEHLLAERRYRSYKLRLPRCLTCFSALTYLLALTPREPAHVSKADVHRMIRLTPLERIEALPRLIGRESSLVDQLLSGYGSYLARTDLGKQALLEKLLHDPAVQAEVSEEGQQFTKRMFELVQELGGGRTLHRHMLV